MLIRKFFQKRWWNGLFILIYLFATLLPAGTASAAGLEGTCKAPSRQTADMPAIRVTSADEEVVIPKEKADSSAYVAHWRLYYKNAFELESIVWNLFFLHTEMRPGSDLLHKFREEYSDIMARNVGGFDGLLNHDEMLHTMLDVAWATPELRRAVPLVWKALSERVGDSIYPDFNDEIADGAKRYWRGDRLLNLLDETLIELHDCAQENPDLAEAVDDFYGGQVKASIRDSAKTIIQKSPDSALLKEIRNHLREDGTISISLNELKELSKAEFEKLHASIDGIQETLVEIDKKQDVIIDYINNQIEKEKDQEVAKAKAAEFDLKLRAAQSSISAITSIAEVIDPEFARGFAVVAGSALQIGVSLKHWVEAVAGLNGLDKVTSLNTVVMTGNVLGAVMNVIKLFGEAQPTPEQLILEEIGRLRQQVNQLREEMHSRFDRIDQELNVIYTTMHERFDQIDIQLGKINGNIAEIQQSLLSLDLKLSRIERNNFEFLNALGRRPLLDAINGGLGYLGRTGVPMPYQPEFVTFENALHGWGTIHAFDAVNAGPTQRNYSDALVLEELNAYPLDSNINYLNGWLVVNGLPPIANERLASPRDWLFASRAYSRLGIEWPEHMRQIDPQRQSSLEEIGVELETAMRKLSTIDTPNGPQGNTLLYTTVISYYQDKLALMNSALEPLETAFVNEVQFNHLNRTDPFDLYGGTNQPLNYVTPEISTLTCGNDPAHGPRPLSSNLKALIPDFELYNLAEYLRVGSFAGCLSDEWQNLVMQTEDDPSRPNDPPTHYWFGQHKAILTIYFDSVPVLRQTIDEGDKRMDFYLPDTWTRDNWTVVDDYKAKFDALTIADTPTPEMLAQQAALREAVKNKVEAALAGYQKGLYQRIIQEMTTGSLKGVAAELGGGKVLIDAFTILGLPRAIGSDEFLHAMLFGSQQLVADKQIVQTYALSITQPLSGTDLLVNPRLLIMQDGSERTDAFRKMVLRYLDAITAGTHIEAADYVAIGRRELDLTMRIARLEIVPGPGPNPDGPNGPGMQAVYLPWVTRQ